MALRSIPAGALLALALTACSGGEPASPDAAATDAPEAAATPEAVPAAVETPSAEAPAADASPAATEPGKTALVEPAKAEAAAAKQALAAAAPPPEVIKVAAAAAPPASFARCATCHTADKGGEDKLGPNLYGVFGKPAAKGGFAFSAPLKEAGLVLDEATLHKWLENPKALVPGNRMSFPGIKDAAKRQEIIAYLKQQS